MVKIPELKSWQLWGVCLVLYLIPIFIPLGSPFEVSEITVTIYELIEDLPEGSIIVMGGSGVFAFDYEPSAAMVSSIKQMERNKLRLVGIPLGTEALQLHKYCVDTAGVLEKHGGSWKYGVDYVQLPYIPGGNAALVRLLEDLHATVTTDAHEKPLSELPLMADFQNYTDIALWVCPHWGYPTIVRYVTGERGVPSVMFAHAYSYTVFAPYMMIYPDKVWMTNGFLGGAQYEKLMGFKGLGHAAVDSYTLISVAYIVFIVIGNVTMYINSKEEEEEIEP